MDKESQVRDFIREKVDDWDDPLLGSARFKAFSGQKSDWEGRYLFWKDLILSISHHFNFIFIKPSQLINQWFSLRGLAPLCLQHVLGVKVSISAATLPSITTLDYDILHLIWTTEKLQQQLDVIDQRYDTLRKSALDSLKSGNKRIALKYARELKINRESREKVSSLLNRVEEVQNAIADAESTKTVTEAIQIGARAMKEHEISWEELQHSLQQLDGSIDLFKQVANAIDSASSCSVLEDEDIEEEFKKFELEVIGQNLEISPCQSGVNVETVTSVPDDSLNEALSNLKLVEGTSTETVKRNSTSNSKGKRLELEIL